MCHSVKLRYPRPVDINFNQSGFLLLIDNDRLRTTQFDCEEQVWVLGTGFDTGMDTSIDTLDPGLGEIAVEKGRDGFAELLDFC